MNWKFSSILLLMNAVLAFATSCSEIRKNINVTMCKNNSNGDANILAIKDEPCTQEMFQYICSITTLEQLQLKHTELYYIPHEITNLKKLIKLDINGNRFKDFSEVLKLTNLKTLIVTDNCISCDNKPTIKGAVTVCNSDKDGDEKCEWDGCGPLFGGHKCSNNQCCSKDGICGKGKNFCSPSKGCQTKFGVCKCSGKYGSCNAGECCSKKGYCGKTADFCSGNKGCQPEFGDCKCGKEFGNCPNKDCCSKKGYCGRTAGYCFPDKGCQQKYGVCKCGKGKGSCMTGFCCSAKGYCGETKAFCSIDKGCQNNYGVCKCDVNDGCSQENNIDFDFSFLKMENRKKNMIYSPLSIKYALKMLQEGAADNTYTEISNVVGNAKLPKYTNIDKVLSLANGLVINDKSYEYIKTKYINTLKEKYEAEIKKDKFKDAKNVNKWIEEKTLGIIKNMIEDETVQNPDLVMLIINALAIDMEWPYKFDRENTYGGSFYKDDGETIKATMMSHENFEMNSIGYYKDDNITVLLMNLKDYDGTQLEFMAIMPKENLSTFIKNVSSKQIDNIDKNLKLASDTPYGVNVVIPKFKFSYDLELKEDLKKLGINDAFDRNNAVFSKMTDEKAKKLYVSDALHKADIEFSEDGIRAAAVTIIEMLAMSPGPMENQPIDIIIDKPFMFIIRDKATKDIWFTGTVYEPNLWSNDSKDYIRQYY